jgi:hypothetical protein
MGWMFRKKIEASTESQQNPEVRSASQFVQIGYQYQPQKVPEKCSSLGLLQMDFRLVNHPEIGHHYHVLSKIMFMSKCIHPHICWYVVFDFISPLIFIKIGSF